VGVSETLRVGVEDTVSEAAGTVATVQVAAQTHDSLVRLAPDGRVAPGIASHWHHHNHLEWFFTIRPNIRFHDGAFADVDAIVWNIRERVRWQCGLASLIISANALTSSLFRIACSRPFPALLTRLSSSRAWIVSPEDGTSGCGSFAPSGHLELERRSSLRCTRIRFVPLRDGAAMFNALERGSIDICYEVPYEVLAGASTRTKDVSVLTRGSLATTFIHFNTRQGSPFADEGARRWLVRALSPSELLRTVHLGVGSAARSPLSPSVCYSRAVEVGWNERSATNPVSPGNFRLSLEASVSSRWRNEVSRRLKALGVTITFERCGAAELLRKARQFDFDAMLLGFAGSPHPDDLMWGLFHSSGIANYSGFASVEYDTLIERARACTNPRACGDLYRRAAEVAGRSLPVAPLRHGLSIVACRHYVKNARPYADSILRLRDVRLVHDSRPRDLPRRSSP
jgi:ABC-type transport system substrate-binding protein